LAAGSADARSALPSAFAPASLLPVRAAAGRFAQAAVVCGWAASAFADGDARRLRTAIGEPASLDPARARSASENAVILQIFSRLLELDASLGLRPSLARAFSVAPDGRSYTFELAPARFHNGRAVEAADVAGSLGRLLAPGRFGPHSQALSLIEGARAFSAGQATELSGVRVLSPQQIEVRLEEPYAPFPFVLAAPALSIVPAREAESAGAGFGRAPVGSGPFGLERWDPGEIALRAHDGAPEGAPLEAGVSFALLPADGQAADRIQSLLLRQELDYVLVPRGLDSEAQALPPGYRRQAHPELAVFYIGFNTRAGAAADLRVRQGFRAGIDRSALSREMFTDSRLVTDSMIPRGLPGFRDDVPAPNAGVARSLFREASAGGRRPRLHLHYTAGRGFDPGFEALATRMAELGLDLALSPSLSLRELQVLQEQGRVEAWFGGIQAESPEPHGLLSGLFRSRPQGSNWFSYASAELDRLLDAARAAADPAERARLYMQVDLALARDVPAIPLWGRTYQYLIAQGVKGFQLGYLPFQIPLARVTLERP